MEDGYVICMYTGEVIMRYACSGRHDKPWGGEFCKDYSICVLSKGTHKRTVFIECSTFFRCKVFKI